MAAATAQQTNVAGRDVDLDAFRRLYPSEFLLQFLQNGVRPDGRPLGRARATSLSLGSLSNTEGSAMVKLGNTTMLAGIKLEVMSCTADAPNEGRLVIDFQMPHVCSPLVRPGRQSELEPVITEQLKNALFSSNILDLKDLCISPGKAAWIAYLDIYCLDADGSLFDAALLASVGALGHLKIPDIAVSEDGKVFLANKNKAEDLKNFKNVQGRRLRIGRVPVSLTCAVHPEYILPDPTAEEESILKTYIIVVSDFSGRLIAFHKPGGEILASTSTVQNCIALAKYRSKELQKIFEDAVSEETEDTSMEAN